MTETLTTTTIPFYLFTQQPENQPNQTAYAWLWISIANPINTDWPGRIENTAVLHIEAGTSPDGGISFETLITNGSRLINLFVDAWQPDSVALTTPDLQGQIDPVDEEWTYARQSYYLWLADRLLPPNQTPTSPYQATYQNGTIVGIDPNQPDWTHQANDLIDWMPLLDCNDNPYQDDD